MIECLIAPVPISQQLNYSLSSPRCLSQHVGLQPTDVWQDPGHPDVAVLFIDHHGDGGGGAYHDDDCQEDVGVHGRPLIIQA